MAREIGEALQLLSCSPTLAHMKQPKTPSKLTRAQITEALDSVPVSHILGKSANRELTAKQKAFALEVAKGSTGAAAYRKAYNSKGSPKLQGSEASKLKARPSIAQEIEAYELAIEAAKHRNPAALRELVIQSLVQVIINPESKPGQITAAAKVLGTVTEVAAFTERKEVRTITSSEDARAKIMQQLKELTKASAIDATLIDRQADDLMAELSAENSATDDTHRTPTPQSEQEESRASMHTIPHEQSPQSLNWIENPDEDDPTPSSEEDPPVA